MIGLRKESDPDLGMSPGMGHGGEHGKLTSDPERLLWILVSSNVGLFENGFLGAFFRQCRSLAWVTAVCHVLLHSVVLEYI